VREAVLTNLWLTALNQLQPYVRCRKASRAGSQTACLIKAGTLLNIWLYFHHGTRVIAVLGESSVCWIYGWTRRLTVPAGACTHACMRRAQGDTMEACVHRMLYCSAVQSSVDSFALRTLA
jgi:hypothetical protein